MHQPVHALDMSVVQGSLGKRVAGEALRYELAVDEAGVFRHDFEAAPSA
jgi:hypothetical protein